MNFNRVEKFKRYMNDKVDQYVQSILNNTLNFFVKYNFLFKLLASILIILICIKFTIYLMNDFVEVSDESAAIIAGIIFGLILSGVIANLLDAAKNFEDLKTIVSERFPRKPSDGEIYKITGILKLLGPPLISPFSKTSCVAYKYKITHEHKNGDISSTEALDANGAAMTLSAIQGKKYELKICGIPDFVGFGNPSVYIKSNSEIFENANQYIRETIFKRLPVTSIIGEIKNFYTDTTGSYRFDVRGNFENLNDKHLSEEFVPFDAEVIGIGEYSSTLNGLIKSKKGRLRIIAGNMDEVRKRLNTKVRAKIIFGITLLLLYVAVIGGMYLLRIL